MLPSRPEKKVSDHGMHKSMDQAGKKWGLCQGKLIIEAPA